MSIRSDRSVFVTGASGFIGKRVAVLLQDEGYKIVLLSRHGAIAALSEAETVSNVEDCDTAEYIIHIAHDHFNGIANKQLWTKLETLADRVGTKGIIVFSSVAVHVPQFKGVLTEADPYARHGDDYVATKIWLEEKAKAWAARNPTRSVWILRPTIVVGLGGNWTMHGLDVAGKKHAHLPFGGKNPCCAVHVQDVAEATLKALNSFSEFTGARSSIISGPDHFTWLDFYELHSKLYERMSGEKSALRICELRSDGKYHDSFLHDVFYRIAFDSIFSSAIRPILGGMRQLVRRRRAQNRKVGETPIDDSWTPQGMSRIFHSSQFTTRANLSGWGPRIPVNDASLMDDDKSGTGRRQRE
ncbi:NAD(P)-dependent oxidoreductase [Pelagibacterium sp. 26DY04]|uniref:NAD-dependent epimerase/dehydratase family protein n=1 Tax=Pelagibacterium sp. 26DY04 TaxID=2967130 RepID=UPI0028168BE3|nr:NAD(P)-dependent oxidoreductase [Pelagibacterium sp. 26DY04]WMT87474.1 NAD(P)-dependent oxidoreductase [Pelagibacterium sp. 26DY04]